METIFTISSEADVSLLVRMRGQTELVLFSSPSNTYRHYGLSPRNVSSAPTPLFCQQVQRSGFILLGNERFSAQETTTSKYILPAEFSPASLWSSIQKQKHLSSSKRIYSYVQEQDCTHFFWTHRRLQKVRMRKKKLSMFLISSYMKFSLFLSLIVWEFF